MSPTQAELTALTVEVLDIIRPRVLMGEFDQRLRAVVPIKRPKGMSRLDAMKQVIVDTRAGRFTEGGIIRFMLNPHWDYIYWSSADLSARAPATVEERLAKVMGNLITQSMWYLDDHTGAYTVEPQEQGTPWA